MRNLILIINLCLLTACATSTRVILPSGKVGYNIDCSGTAVAMSKCYVEAGQVCSSGYEIVSSFNDVGSMSDFKGGVIPTSNKGLMIKCY